MRPAVSPPVTAALVDTGNEQVITAVLENDGASFSDETIGKVVEQSADNERYQTLLAGRRDLPPAVAKKLYWMVSAALRVHITRTYEIDEGELDRTVEVTVKRVLGESEAPAQTEATQHAMAPEKEAELLGAVERGMIMEFIEMLAAMSGLRLSLLQRLLFEEGGEGLAILCTALGISKAGFCEIFIRFRQGRLGDKQVAADELSRAMDFYDRSDPASAAALVARWRRDPDYLNALRQVEAG
jgi:uncharacterized protein (DUF2336 family)